MAAEITSANDTEAEKITSPLVTAQKRGLLGVNNNNSRRQRPASSSYMFTPIDVAALGKESMAANAADSIGDSSADFDTRQVSPYSQRRTTGRSTAATRMNGGGPSRPQAVRPVSNYFDPSSNFAAFAASPPQDRNLNDSVVVMRRQHQSGRQLGGGVRPTSLYAMNAGEGLSADSQRQSRRLSNIQSINANYQLRHALPELARFTNNNNNNMNKNNNIVYSSNVNQLSDKSANSCSQPQQQLQQSAHARLSKERRKSSSRNRGGGFSEESGGEMALGSPDVRR